MNKLLIILIALTITAPARADIKDDRIAELERENRLLKADVYRAKQALTILKRKLPGFEPVKPLAKKTQASDFRGFTDLVDTIKGKLPSNPSIFNSYTNIAMDKMQEPVRAAEGKVITLTVRLTEQPTKRVITDRVTKVRSNVYKFRFVSNEGRVTNDSLEKTRLAIRHGSHWCFNGDASFPESYRDRLARMKYGDVIKIQGTILHTIGNRQLRTRTFTLNAKKSVYHDILLNLKDCKLLTH